MLGGKSARAFPVAGIPYELVRALPVLSAILLRLGIDLDTWPPILQPDVDLHPSIQIRCVTGRARSDSPFPIILGLCPDLFGFTAMRTRDHFQCRLDRPAFLALGNLQPRLDHVGTQTK